MGDVLYYVQAPISNKVDWIITCHSMHCYSLLVLALSSFFKYIFCHGIVRKWIKTALKPH